MDILNTIFKEKCAERITTDVKTAFKKATTARLTKQQTRDDKLQEARDRLWQDDDARTRLPRNILSETATEIQRRFAILPEDFNQSMLREKFDQAWEEELLKPIQEPTLTEGTTTADAHTEHDAKDIRDVSVPLSRIIRKDLFTEEQDDIPTKIQNTLERVQSDFFARVASKANEVPRLNYEIFSQKISFYGTTT
ncbi:hypothetical protein BGZ96_003857 [Linnemannia gamsii]|uniref:Uncharacterized protein n=1 Tax=Linnemannia gamsii TaxID=64522 RepID=A0ABQ7JIP7_9FUNG|nr:hypothetical protein BGZ96_003857 [Linnemannia gamsii]